MINRSSGSGVLASANAQLLARRKQNQRSNPSQAGARWFAGISAANIAINQTNNSLKEIAYSAPNENQSTRSISLSPSLAAQSLKTGQVGLMRLWLLLRHIDQSGSGRILFSDAKAALSQKERATYLCGQRHLRSLLQRGRGVYWERDAKTIWLRSLPKVAHALGIDRLKGHPIEITPYQLQQPIGEVRALFYAIFHSSNEQPKKEATAASKQIARVTVQQCTGVSRRAQRSYEQRAGILARKHIQIKTKVNGVDVQDEMWRQGAGIFIYTDRKGKYGQPGQQYIAQQKPNSYHITLPRGSRGRQKQQNRQLSDLRKRRDAGNGSTNDQLVYVGLVNSSAIQYKTQTNNNFGITRKTSKL